MKVYCMEDYRIKHHCGRSEPTGTFYITRNGKKKAIMEYVITYETKAGEFSPEDWKIIVKKCVKEAGSAELLMKIIEHCRTQCVWLKTEKEREEYALNILIGRSYRFWEDFVLGGIAENTAFVFNFSKEELCGGLREVWADT